LPYHEEVLQGCFVEVCHLRNLMYQVGDNQWLQLMRRGRREDVSLDMEWGDMALAIDISPP
jgi:hypothetical protein